MRTAGRLAVPLGLLALVRIAGAVGAQAARRAGEPGPAADPFATLEAQHRLGRLADDLEALTRSGVCGRERHYRRTLWRYDVALARACRLAGVPTQRSARQSRDVTRLLAEAALDRRGWTW